MHRISNPLETWETERRCNHTDFREPRPFSGSRNDESVAAKQELTNLPTTLLTVPIHEEYQDVLQNLEFSVIALFRENPEMTDYVALRAYEAAYERYRAEQRGHTPKPHGLTGLDAKACEAVCAICEFQLGRDPGPGRSGPAIKPLSAEEIVACLRRLTRSVKLHTERAGRQGYLNYVGHFVR